MIAKKNLPKSKSGQDIQLTPSSLALAQTTDDAVLHTGETDIALNGDTSIVRVTAVTNGLFMKYGTPATSSDYDEYIPVGSTFDYVIPTGVTVLSFIGDGATAGMRVIEK